MSDTKTPTVQVSFRHTEKEYLAAARLYFWNSKELLARLIISYVFLSGGLFVLAMLVDLSIPPWVLIILILLVGVAGFHGYVIDLPRRYFRGDPKFREEYHLTYTEAGIEYKTLHASGSFAWSFYTDVIENESLYLLIYGKDLPSITIVPKRAFQDSKQELAFRDMLRRHVNHKLKTGDREIEKQEYSPRGLEPPDWR